MLKAFIAAGGLILLAIIGLIAFWCMYVKEAERDFQNKLRREQGEDEIKEEAKERLIDNLWGKLK